MNTYFHNFYEFFHKWYEIRGHDISRSKFPQQQKHGFDIHVVFKSGDDRSAVVRKRCWNDITVFLPKRIETIWLRTPLPNFEIVDYLQVNMRTVNNESMRYIIELSCNTYQIHVDNHTRKFHLKHNQS